MHSRTGAVAIIGSLAISSALLLGGCGGNSTTAATSSAAAAAAASSGAMSAGPVASTEWNPPRPSGVEDDVWASMGADPAASLDTPEELAKSCQGLKPPRPSDIDALVAIAPKSNAQEWTAYGDYMYAYATQFCANAPDPEPVVYEAAGACDLEAYAYCITPDMDGQTIEIQDPDQAFIDIAGVSVACEGTGMASTMSLAGPDGDFSFTGIYTMGNPGVAGDAVCTVTGNADGATVMTLNVTVLDPA